jgi:hypothetical protein
MRKEGEERLKGQFYLVLPSREARFEVSFSKPPHSDNWNLGDRYLFMPPTSQHENRIITSLTQSKVSCNHHIINSIIIPTGS